MLTPGMDHMRSSRLLIRSLRTVCSVLMLGVVAGAALPARAELNDQIKDPEGYHFIGGDPLLNHAPGERWQHQSQSRSSPCQQLTTLVQLGGSGSLILLIL